MMAVKPRECWGQPLRSNSTPILHRARGLYGARGMRVTRLSVLVVAASFASACSASNALGRLDSRSPDQALALARSITNEYGDRPAWVAIEEPDKPDEYVHTPYGTLSIADQRTFRLRVPAQEDRRIPFERTRQITYRSRGWGGLGGAGIGLAGGAVAGVAVPILYNAWNAVDCFMSSDGDSYNKPSSCNSRMDRMTGFTYGAVIGAAMGAVVGAVTGHKTYFTF
jgi:hypothetical protein